MSPGEKHFRDGNVHLWSPEKEKSAVLLIDLQEYFRELVRPVLNPIVRLLDASRAAGVPLFFTRHAHEQGEDPGVLGHWWGDLIWEGTPEAELLPELAVRESDVVVPKNRYSAFFGTMLEDKLKSAGIRDLIIGGVMTNLCCETTARDAFVRDFRVFFLADGSATSDSRYHEATLMNLAYGFATLMSCSEAVEALL